VTAFTVDTPKAAHIVGMSNHIEATVRELDFVQGTSDKFYRVFTLGTTMVVQYGRNGTFGSISSKEFDDAAAAAKAADKQVAAKMAKGYQPVRSGGITFDHDPTDNELDTAANVMPRGESTVAMPAQREPSAAVTATNSAPADEAHAATFAKVLAALDAYNAATLPVDANPPASIPMLARVVTLTTVDRLMEDGMWVVQPKLDGERVLIEVTDGAVSVLNRAGQPKAKNVSEAMLAPFRALTEGRWVFDGEIIGRTVHLFDLAAAGRYVSERSGFTTRHANLVIIVDALVDPSDPAVRVLTYSEDSDAKRNLLDRAEIDGKEGVIFRHITSPYEPGNRSEGLVKWKFLKEVDAEVVQVGKGGKANAVLAVYDHDGKQVVIGQVSTLGRSGVVVGAVVEVAFLYITNAAHPVLFQPRIVRVRTDEKTAAECSIDQLAAALADKTVS